MRTLRRHELWRNVEGLTIEVRIVLNYSKDKWAVGHHNLYIVRLAGDSLEVSDWEIDPFSSLVPHEPDWDNVCLVVGWGVVGRGGGDFLHSPNLAMAHGGPIGMAERGCLVANWYSELELGVGNGSGQNIS